MKVKATKRELRRALMLAAEEMYLVDKAHGDPECIECPRAMRTRWVKDAKLILVGEDQINKPEVQANGNKSQDTP